MKMARREEETSGQAQPKSSMVPPVKRTIERFFGAKRRG